MTTIRVSALALSLGDGDDDDGLGDRGNVGELGSDISLKVDVALPRRLFCSIHDSELDLQVSADAQPRLSWPINHIISPFAIMSECQLRIRI